MNTLLAYLGLGIVLVLALTALVWTIRPFIPWLIGIFVLLYVFHTLMRH